MLLVDFNFGSHWFSITRISHEAQIKLLIFLNVSLYTKLVHDIKLGFTTVYFKYFLIGEY
jgi:hypothetical protein